MNSVKKPRTAVIFAYLFLSLAIYLFSVFLPLASAFFNSFFAWKGGPNKTYIGLQNYQALLGDRVFWTAFGHNIYLVLMCVVGQVGIAFIFVMVINTKRVRAKNIHRIFGFFPSTISPVAIGFIWMMIYDSRRGLLNWFLNAIGQSDHKQAWLNNPKLVMLLVSIPLIWQYIGYYMLILLSALSSIDHEILESAELDGASTLQKAIHIILPLIKSTIVVCLVLCISGNMKAFDNIYVMTKGGPGNASMVMALYSYKISFGQQNMGYGSAVSIAIFFLGLILIGSLQFIIQQFNKEK